MNGIKSSDLGEKSACRVFFMTLVLILLSTIVAVCLGLIFRSRHLLEDEILSMAHSHFNNILLTRRWNACYGGVYVIKGPGVESNPFLPDPDIQTADGVTLTLKNPAIMTREISRLATEQGNYSFHITSLKPINPANTPDKLERAALMEFENGAKNSHWTETKNGEDFFNYMAPLYVEERCLKCHADQGYKTGDIRGGIKVEFSIQRFEDLRNRTLTQFLITAAIFAAGLMATLYMLMHRFEQRLAEARQKIQDMAIKDPLTGVYNRRYLMLRIDEELDRLKRKKNPLGCIMIDIDFFKRINDCHGHLFGDEVLRQLCQRIGRVIRQYDTLARYGGEEFAVLVCDADLQACASVADRIIRVVKEHPFTYKDISCNVTLSAGVTCATTGDIDSQELIKRADEALYRAKQQGRDQIVVDDNRHA